jgi:hypothetical protein
MSASRNHRLPTLTLAAGTLLAAQAQAAIQLPSVDLGNNGGSDLTFNIKDGASQSYTLDLGLVMGTPFSAAGNFNPASSYSFNLAVDPLFAPFMPLLPSGTLQWGVTGADNVFAGTGPVGDPSYGTRIMTTTTAAVTPTNGQVLNDANGWAVYVAALNTTPNHDDGVVANDNSSFTNVVSGPTSTNNYNNMGNDLGGGFAVNGGVGQSLSFLVARQTSQNPARPGQPPAAGPAGAPAIIEMLTGTWNLSQAGLLTWNPVGNSAVPLPPAVWLFASAVLGLVSVARRRDDA